MSNFISKSIFEYGQKHTTDKSIQEAYEDGMTDMFDKVKELILSDKIWKLREKDGSIEYLRGEIFE